jgi:hypothetical protein
MPENIRTIAPIAVLLLPMIGLAAPPLSGAIFTTTVDGDVVNENVHYDAKTDVYLDGGPGPNAPAKAAGLPEGDYYFQVTDPSGQDLLSTDHISCRRIHVSGDGVITQIYSGTNYEKVKGSYAAVTCQHAEGVDQDHGDLGALTVQLYPYDDTPNPGGVYKVWITPVDDYTGDANLSCIDVKGSCIVNGESYSAGNFHGFVPAASKTDNYKVKQKGKPFTAPTITVQKFHDANLNGVWDSGEEEVTGWSVSVTDPLGVENAELTPSTIVAGMAGTFSFEEDTPDGTLQTASYLDGSADSLYPDAFPVVDVVVANTSGETHSVIFGNVGLGSATACKVFDRDGDGEQGADEPLIAGWQFTLSGLDIAGGSISETGYTDSSGCVTFSDLLPGSYTLTEGTPTSGDWVITGDESVDLEITSSLDGATISGTAVTVDFFNQLFETADFGTKGYWHNKNGLAELTADDIDAVNLLEPYSAASSYFEDGDEPFDGTFEDGTSVSAVTGEAGSAIAPEGSANAEVSWFLVDANNGGTNDQQLAQQLLAFIFNVQHRLDSEDALIELSDGTLVAAGDLIDEAIDAWLYGTDSEQVAIKSVLDELNNSDALSYVPASPGTPGF